MATKLLERVDGLVEQVSARGTGIKVAGEWLNVSQYRPIAELPARGQRVDVQVERTDRGAWIHGLEVLDEGKLHELPTPFRRGDRRPQADARDIRRLAVLKAAAAFGASRPEMKSTDVLRVADAWVTWVERPGREVPTDVTRATVA